MVNDSLTFTRGVKLNVKESLTIRRAIIIGQYNNEQVKLFVFRQLALRIMIPRFKNFFYLIRTNTKGKNYWLWIKIMINQDKIINCIKKQVSLKISLKQTSYTYHARYITHLGKLITEDTCNTILHIP